jgi:hypothetical protein
LCVVPPPPPPPRPVIPVVWCDTYGSCLKPDYGDVIKIKEKV